MKKTNKVSADEMRILIKSIYELAQKLSGNISIKNLDNAAEFAVNLYGYKNWKEFKQNLNKDLVVENLEEIEKELLESNYNAKKDKKIVSIENYNFKNRKEEIIFWTLPERACGTPSSIFPIPTKLCGHEYLRPCYSFQSEAQHL